MGTLLTHQINSAAAWKGCDLTDQSQWVLHLSENSKQAIDRALRKLQLNGKTFPRFSRKDFELPELAAELGTIARNLEEGHGFILLRGLPIERYTDDEIDTIYFGIGLNLGTPVTQNPGGDLVGKVMNVGDPNDKHTRVYETNLYLPYHTDPSDVVGLLCIRKARSGGLSSLISTATVHNEILKKHREYLSLFYRPTHYAHLATEGFVKSPIFSFHEGKLSCRYLRQYIELGHELANTQLSNIEVEAFDLFDSISQDPQLRLDMMLEPGDLQFANNYAVMHSRTDFTDDENQWARRKMLRLWLKMPNARQLAPEFPGRNGFGAPEWLV